jgi:hypothetical protein
VQVTGVDLGEAGQNIYTTVGSVPFDKIQAVGATGFTSAKVREVNAALDLKKNKVADKEPKGATDGGTAAVQNQDGPAGISAENDPTKEPASEGKQGGESGDYSTPAPAPRADPGAPKKVQPASEGTKSVSADQLPPEIRKSLEQQFGGNAKTSPAKPSKIAVTNPPVPKNEVEL